MSFLIPHSHMYDGVLLTESVLFETIDRLSDFIMVEGDVLIASYPKTGTTWMEELAWLLCNNGDTYGAKCTPVYVRVPYLEYSGADNKTSGLDQIMAGSRPAIMKTHLKADTFMSEVLKDRVKVILPIRNPKDTWVSLYHFYRMQSRLGNFPGSWDDFFPLCSSKSTIYGDYFDWYLSWLPLISRDNVLMVKYEDMKRDLSDVILKVSNFLRKPLPKDSIGDVISHLSFESMRNNPSTNYADVPHFAQDISPFIRKGVVGDWKNYFSGEQSNLVDRRYRENFVPLGISLDFE